jgi:hypothetical protein
MPWSGREKNLLRSLLFLQAGAYVHHAHGRVRDYDHAGRFLGRLVGRIDTGSRQQNPGQACTVPWR